MDMYSKVLEELRQTNRTLEMVFARMEQIQTEQAALFNAIQNKAQESSRQLYPTSEAYYMLGFDNPESLRHAIRKGEFLSGTEIQKRGRRFVVDVLAYKTRKTKEQSRRRVV